MLTGRPVAVSKTMQPVPRSGKEGVSRFWSPDEDNSIQSVQDGRGLPGGFLSRSNAFYIALNFVQQLHCLFII